MRIIGPQDPDPDSGEFERERSPRGLISPERAKQLGYVKDAVAVGERGAAWGFGVARRVTSFGFGVASFFIQTPAVMLEAAAGPNAVSSGLRGVDGVVSAAHAITSMSQDAAAFITKASLGAAKAGLSAAGARDGELLRLAIGDDAAEAVGTIESIANRFCEPLTDIPLDRLLGAANVWGGIQLAAQQTQPPRPVAILPADSERWLRFSAATFGAALLGGLLDGLSPDVVARLMVSTQTKDAGLAALAAAGVIGRVDVVSFEQKTKELFAPGYMVAVDHDSGTVVVALRGTSSIKDALVDLVCHPTPIQLGGQNGFAHGGMMRAAVHLEDKLAGLAQSGLERINSTNPRLVITGHSLGAGVAALVAALWRDKGRFPGVHAECFAFACPQVLDSSLAMAQYNHTTSFVVGDDVVPRLSLATAYDLQKALVVLTDPEAEAFSVPHEYRLDRILEAASRGDSAELADTYAHLRPFVRAIHGRNISLEVSEGGRLYPPGRLVELREGAPPRSIDHEDVDEIRISADMLNAHLPRRYLLAIREGTPRNSSSL